jgi:hypothetical protein
MSAIASSLHTIHIKIPKKILVIGRKRLEENYEE